MACLQLRRCSDPQQQLAQLKLLRARAVAGQQLRLRVARARRQLMAQARLAAVLAGTWGRLSMGSGLLVAALWLASSCARV
jgi:hypothetical protein